ncbi:hypothetical protein VTK73DRAFT_9808 [Phialemonium thermophilum]|uniref:Glutathione S-transferase n=1 Tax=Phialemonium thermophilum TaxID=223376 RepID=A0ABR3XIG2_9PEZI
MASEQAKVKLHWLNGSRAQGILFLFEQLQIPYELEIYHRNKDKLAPPELTKVHPLGKAPVVTITPESSDADPIVLAETPFIVQYFSEHFPSGESLVPKRWKEGREGQVGGETAEWMRYQYIMYYAEGSFMAQLVLYVFLSALKGDAIPFFIRPISKLIANQIISMFSFPTLKKHFTMLESYLATPPSDGAYLCGPKLTGADIVLAFPLISGLNGAFDNIGQWEKGSFAATFPRLHAYMERLEKEPAWTRSAQKIRDIEGSFSVSA